VIREKKQNAVMANIKLFAYLASFCVFLVIQKFRSQPRCFGAQRITKVTKSVIKIDFDLYNSIFSNRYHFNSKTTTENGGIFNVRLEPEIAAPLKTAGFIFVGSSKEL